MLFFLLAVAGSTGCSGGEGPEVPSSSDASAIDVVTDAGGRDAEPDAANSFDASTRSAPEDGGKDASSDEVAPGATLCVRVDDLQHPDVLNQLTVNVTRQYLRLAGSDCDVAKVIPSNDETYLFANQLLEFNLALWGCAGHPPPTSFDLIPTSVVELTSADAARLVDHYIEAATIVLELSPREEARLRQDLLQLSDLAGAIESSDHLLSRCGDDAGSDDQGAVDASRLDATDERSNDGEASSEAGDS